MSHVVCHVSLSEGKKEDSDSSYFKKEDSDPSDAVEFIYFLIEDV